MEKREGWKIIGSLWFQQYKTGKVEITIGKRIASMLLDHIAMSFVAVVFFVPGMMLEFEATGAGQAVPGRNPLPFGYVGLIGFALYFCKDCIHGRSIAKRAVDHQVVERSSGKIASPLRCIVRNIFCIIWPVEVIVTIISPGRRLGDRVAGTQVVPYNPGLKRAEINYGELVLALVLAYGLSVLMMFPFM